MGIYTGKDASLTTDLTIELINKGSTEGLVLRTKTRIASLSVDVEQGITLDGSASLRLLREMMSQAENNGWLKPGSVMGLMSQFWPGGHKNPTGLVQVPCGADGPHLAHRWTDYANGHVEVQCVGLEQQ
jgi:hypothetical protein